MERLKKLRNPLIAAAIFLLCLAVFAVFWHLEVAEARTKSPSAYLNDTQDAFTLPLAQSGEIRQSFVSEQPFHALGVLPGYAGDFPAGSLHMAVYDDAGNLLAQASGNSAHTMPGTYAVFVFPETLDAPGGRYTLVFSAQLQDAVQYSLAKSGQALDGWHLQENGRAAGGSLCLLISYGSVGTFLTRFYWAFALLASAFLSGLWLLVATKRLALHTTTAVAIVALGLLFCAILPPYSAPDEQFHINQTFTLSSTLLGQTPKDLEWDQNVRRAADADETIQNLRTTVYTYQRIAQQFFTRTQNATPTVFDGEQVSDQQALYAPAALAVTLCRLLGLGFVPTLYAGRLVNLLLYALCAALAVKLAPFGKSVFAGVALLPMGIHLAASFSRDCLMIALYLLYTALCLYYAYEKPRLTGWDAALLLGIAFLAGPVKMVYAPLLLLCLLIPGKKFTLRGKALPRWGSFATKAAIVVVGCAPMLLNMGGALQQGTASTLQQGVASTLPTFGALGTEEVIHPDAIRFSVADFFATPGVVITLFLRTIATQFTFWLQTLVGGNLGYYNLPLDWGFVIVLLFLLAVSCLPMPGEGRLTRRHQGASALVVLAVCALVLLGCYTWTPSYYTVLYGVQGRYFLPVLPLALLCLSHVGTGLRKTRALSYPLVFCFAGAGVFALLNALLLVLAR
ncbi:DUF2142 domain-containing protein [Ruminococcaceae bacterium OttesenSCG-928-O06]|nr:DUF2142 domain-containing protein [Ruminococcaceae bacterium OttesenSCG-928-O06]